jgi:6-pyruvoyltetrahydropterin/6-carboxytetrahydropterin synthase
MHCISTEHSFDSAHFLKGYEGKCSNIHGHRWRVVVDACSESLVSEGQERGMVMDFSRLKSVFREMVDRYDHALIMEKGTLKRSTEDALREEGFNIVEVDFRPTAEEFARHFYELLDHAGIRPGRVTVFETPTNSASYGKAAF